MAAVVIPGLTPDDKVPGPYNYLNYGVGRSSPGAFPSYCKLVGNKMPGSVGTITRGGGTSGPAITASSSDATTETKTYTVEITTGGAVETAVLKWTDDGGDTETTGVTSASTVTLANGVEIQMPAGTYVLGETYTFTVTTGGTAALNTLYPIFSDEESEAYFGEGSELDVMCKAALAIEGVSLKAMACAGASGAAAATLTITIGGTWTANGEVGCRIMGKVYRVGVTTADDSDAVAARLSAEFNADTSALFTSSVSTSTITLTMKTPGIRGNTVSAWKLTTLAPAGLTMALSGGTAYTGGGVPFSSGSGTDDVTAALAALLPNSVFLYDFFGWAQQDASNLALIEAQMDVKAGPLVANYEQSIFAVNGTQAAAISLAQTTLNHILSMLLLDEEGESYPPAMAAQFAAIRSVTEPSNANPDYDGRQLPTMVPRAAVAEAKEPTHTKLKAQLNAGVTPVATVDGEKQIVRCITTKCLEGGVPFYGSIEPGDATVPMLAARQLSSVWSVFKANNPAGGPDPDIANGEKPAEEGVGTPNNWLTQINGVLEDLRAAKLIHQVAQNPASAYWDDDAERIMSAVPLKVRPINHQVGNELRQLA